MIRSYTTEYPNQVHQVVVSVSRHFFIKKDGGLAYQKKPIETSPTKVGMLTRRHVVHYLVRDHFSGAFYAEIHPIDDMSDIAEFLYRAWSRKEVHPFCGIPDFITIAASVIERFPRVQQLIHAYGIEFVKATSGFQSGIRDLRTWEENIRGRLGLSHFDQLQGNAPALSRQLCEGRFDKLAKWRDGMEQVRIPRNREEFIAAYHGKLTA
ncbi:MAG: hypothetical protein HQM06_15830 [Magnetococcales bacterium]|nr:hypothetical protein [Magnetococcales bacterium]